MSGNTIAPGPLELALNIVNSLNGFSADTQSLAIKFAIETLGLQKTLGQFPKSFDSSLASAPLVTEQRTIVSGKGDDNSSTAIDIKSFTDSKSPKSDQQFVAVVAYYYQFKAPLEERKDSIDVDTLKDAARLVQWKQPSDWRFTLKNAKNAGILNSKGVGGYCLSPVGENLVAITLPSNGTPPHAANDKKKTKKSHKKPAASVKKNTKNSR